MQIIRDLVGAVFTSASVCLIMALTWWLLASKAEKISSSVRMAAAGKIGVFGGLLLSQLYMALVTYHTAHFGEPTNLTPYAPIALLAIVLVVAGSVALVWVYRPSKMPRALWAVLVIGLALSVAIFKLYIWPLI